MKVVIKVRVFIYFVPFICLVMVNCIDSNLNMVSFVTTWMETECDQLIIASINKYYVDMDEYPITTELQINYFSL